MARQRLFKQPMTDAQRQQRRRDKQKAAQQAQPAELQLRQDFYHWLENYLLTRPEMREDVGMISHAIGAVITMVRITSLTRARPDGHQKPHDQEMADDWLYNTLYDPDDGFDRFYKPDPEKPKIAHVSGLFGRKRQEAAQ